MNKAVFWDRIARKYAASPVSDEASYEKKLALTQALMTSEMDALEIGCGTGSTALIHAPHVKFYRATDFSETMIEIARGKGPVPDNLSFEVAEFDHIPLEDESLDMVLGLSVLHLVPDPKATIAKAFRALRPGGHLVTSTALLSGMWWLKIIAPLGQAIGRFPHLSYLSADSLRQMMRDAGFMLTEDWQPDGGTVLFLIAQKPV